MPGVVTTDCYLTGLNISSLINMKVCRDFKEGLSFNLVKWMHGQSNLLDTHFSRTLIFTCFFIGLINNQMFTSEPNVHHKLLISQLGKLSNIVINYTCLLLFSNTLHKFLQKGATFESFQAKFSSRGVTFESFQAKFSSSFH